jgi:crossover junction endodeoxyribonuclease RusA
MAESLTIRLPYPPSANRLWRNVPGRTKPMRSVEYDAWLISAAWEVKRVVAMSYDRKGVKGPYALTVKVCPPDRRRRDLGNLLKALEDGLVKGGAVEDDHLCQRVELEWDAEMPEGVTATVMTTKLRIPPEPKKAKRIPGFTYAADHTDGCEWHVDQYPEECTCGAVRNPRRRAAEVRREGDGG